MFKRTIDRLFHIENDKSIMCIVLFSILLNLAGKILAEYAELPVWFDSYGTMVAAYVLGPLAGGIVGFFTNAIASLENPIHIIYGISNFSIGIIAGYAARKHYFDDIYHSLITASWITLATVFISTPLNLILLDGYTQNIWGDGVVGYFLSRNMSIIPAAILGEFYIDFIDKGILAIFVCLCIHYIRKMQGKKVIPLAFFRLKNISMLLIPILLMVSLNFSVAAESENIYGSYLQTVYGKENGIPCGKVNDIAQTNDGVLWLGTYAGLYRYNGKDFQLMKDMESVKNANCLFVDEESRLWIGTNDNGVSIVIKNQVVNVLDKKSGLPSNKISNIVQSSTGKYYIGNSDELTVVSLNGGLKIVKTFDDIKNVKFLAADENGNVAAITYNGELVILNNDKVIARQKITTGQGQFLSCAFDTDGTLLVGSTSNIIYVFDIKNNILDGKGNISCGLLNNINNIKPQDGKKYICAENGIGYFDENGSFKQLFAKEFNNSIENMLVDYQGSVWFTSSRQGLLRLSKSPFENMLTAVNLPERVVNTIDKLNNKFYIGTDTGLFVVDESIHSLVKSPLSSMLAGTRIRCIKHDSNNNLWICSYGKGVMMEAPSGEVRTYTVSDGLRDNRTRTMLELHDGTIAIAGNQGINFIKNNEIVGGIGAAEGLGNASILCMLEQADGTILAGSDGNGIIKIKDGAVTEKITCQNGLSSDVILRMVNDTVGGGIYIVNGNGLSYMDKEGKVSIFNNLPYYNNYDMFEGENNKLFLISSAGIYIFDREQLFSGEEIKYELLDARVGLYSGLMVNAWNYFDDDGYAYLGCDTGVVRMNIKNYYQQFRSLRMMIDNIKLDDNVMTFDNNGNIFIPNDVKKIELFPEIINYSVQDPYVSYYLEGVDANPVIMRQSELSSIRYTNIPGGNYKFTLCILAPDKKTVLESISCNLNKEAKIYDYIWFKAYLLIVFILLVVWITWVIIRSQVQRTIEMQRKQLEFAKKQVQMADETVLTIARTVDAKDENTSQHSARVAEYSVLIGKALGMNDNELQNLKRAAIVHDIGKIAIPDSVLNKPGQLTDDEYIIMKNHVLEGAKILKDFTLVDRIIEGVLYHHERYDGSGYIHGLKGKEIPLFARIIGVADAFDAMTANRVYRKKMDIDYVLEELNKGKYKQFDGELIDILFNLIDSGKIDINKIYNDSFYKN